jgi:DNA-binding transcriptional ArsR family regulator
MTATDALSATLAAVADPTRRAILARLRDGEASVTELAAPFAMSVPAISKHLKVLERAGLLTRSRDAQFRPCRLRPEGLRPAADWLEAYRELWEQRLDRMAAYLAELQRAPTTKTKTSTPRNKNKTSRKP